MSTQNDRSSADPTQCAAGCGFFGTPERNNMCSKCFKEREREASTSVNDASHVAKETTKSSVVDVPSSTTTTTTTTTQPTTSTMTTTSTASTPSTPTPTPTTTAAAEAVSMNVDDNNNSGERTVQKNKERCFQCRKKVGLLGFTCKCDFVFCSSHRYPKEHQCTYDHASVTRSQLTKQNPLIQAPKLDKI